MAHAYAVGTKAIADGRIEFIRARPVDAPTYATWTERAAPQAGDIILCREAPVGPVALVPDAPPVCLGQRTVLLRPDPKIADGRFLLYALLTPETQSVLRTLAEGSTVPHLNVDAIRRFNISLPNLDEQKAVAAILRALDDKIDSNRQLARLLEEAAATLFRARFVDFVGVEEFDESEIGRVPRGWRPGVLSEIAAVHRHLVNGANDLPYIGLDAMPRGSTVLAEWVTDNAPRGQAATFDAGDILFGKLRPYFHKVGVAPVSGRCSTEILVLRPARPEFHGVVLGHVASKAFIDHCVSVSRGTRMPRAEWRDAAEFKIAIPPTAEAADLTSLARTMYAQIRMLTLESRTLAGIRDAILPKLVSGHIRVPDIADPAELIEPAAEALEAAAP